MTTTPHTFESDGHTYHAMTCPSCDEILRLDPNRVHVDIDISTVTTYPFQKKDYPLDSHDAPDVTVKKKATFTCKLCGYSWDVCEPFWVNNLWDCLGILIENQKEEDVTL